MAPYSRSIVVLLLVMANFAFITVHGATLHQGWDDATAQRYYHESQGTRFMPAALLEALYEPSGTRFMDPANMQRFGFITGERGADDRGNPYGWPIGFAVDRDRSGVAMAGITCAACHTSQITYNGATVRIEGGSADIDVASFRKALAQAVLFTGADQKRKADFEERAVALGFPRSHVESAFEHILKTTQSNAASPPDYVVASTPSGPGRLDALNAIATAVFATDLGVPGNAKKGDAPVRFPYLWDIWRFDWVQYNASVRQPMDRNIGEALGVGIQTNFIDPATGQVNSAPLRWQTTARVHNLYWIENALSRLSAPAWPHAFGPIDAGRAQRGRALFATYCARCHAIQTIDGTTPEEWHVPVVPLATIGTDRNQAVDYAKHTFDATKLGLGARVRTPAGLAYVVEQVKRQAYLDAGIPESDWPAYDGFGRTTNAYIAPCGYKARPLIGVWATGPFLHNGSVPTIYDLLSERRPSTFWVGSEEFDPMKVGFVDSKTPASVLFDTRLPGNSNAGHWFTNDGGRRGRIGPALNELQKYAIIEYLKSATTADYPVKSISKVPPMPCENDPSWADDL
jgi:hypothetical protein